MSDINLDFTSQNNNINIVAEPNDITFTPNEISLTLYTGGFTDTATGLNANVANVHIYGGDNGYVLQTDGTGNLSWTAQTGGGGGNGVPGGANTQIQYNDSGSFGGNAGFTFDEVTGVMSVPSGANIGNTIINTTGITTPGVYGDITGCNLISTVSLTASNDITANTVIANNILTTSVLGYNSGASGSVTQLTSRTTDVTLNNPTGFITLFTTTLAGNTQQQFTLINSYISSTDMILIQHVSGGTMGLYNVTATPSNGSAVISIRNNSAGASSSQAPVLQFMILKAS